ncbi:MAG: hypothetical protein HY308_16795 [Gammaproteobacteria bacterium]|nr:hypothetical protein [Gammaproteobacteria bacterium]
MTKKQKDILGRLLRLANGDVLLVERALRRFSDKPGSSKELVQFIKDNAPKKAA